nr:flavodoxin family protein [Altererythrobacter segetis]
MSRVLVVDYSRTGNTHLVAKALARELGADLERVLSV